MQYQIHEKMEAKAIFFCFVLSSQWGVRGRIPEQLKGNLSHVLMCSGVVPSVLSRVNRSQFWEVRESTHFSFSCSSPLYPPPLSSILLLGLIWLLHHVSPLSSHLLICCAWVYESISWGQFLSWGAVCSHLFHLRLFQNWYFSFLDQYLSGISVVEKALTSVNVLGWCRCLSAWSLHLRVYLGNWDHASQIKFALRISSVPSRRQLSGPHGKLLGVWRPRTHWKA